MQCEFDHVASQLHGYAKCHIPVILEIISELLLLFFKEPQWQQKSV